MRALFASQMLAACACGRASDGRFGGAVLGKVDEQLDGRAVQRADLGGRTDFIGVNYYLRATAKGMPQPLFPAEAPLMTFDPFTLDLRADGAGISEALEAAAKYRLPIYVTETGSVPPELRPH